MKKATATHKGRNIAFGILGFLILVIIGGIWYWNTHKKAIIKNKLESAIRDKSNGLYKINYDSLGLDELAGDLSILNMSIVHDSLRYRELEIQRTEPSILLNIHIPEINVTGVKTPRALIKNEIVGRKLEIKNPVIHIVYTNTGKDSARAVPSREVYEQLLGSLRLIQADTILISGAQITTASRKTNKTSLRLQDVSITLVDVKIDSAGSADTSRLLFAKEISIHSGKLAWSSADKLYNYSADSISVTSASRVLRVNKFRIAPTLNEEAFVKALPAQGDRFDVVMNTIQLQNINLQQLLEENILADNMLITGANFKIYRDLIIPRDTKNRVGAYPHQLMQTIPVTFLVRKIVLANGYIEYKERHNISRLAGKIHYHNVNATISNFTNDKKAIAVSNLMRIDMSTSFLNKAPLKVTGQFYLRHPNGRYDLSGTFGAMDATLLNPVIERTGLTSIKRGKINGAEFNLNGSDYNIDGTVVMRYEDLKVAALEKDRGATELDKKSLSSFIVNIVIKNDNPSRNGEVRQVQVHLDRDVTKSFFNFSWKAILKGITESVGLKK